MCEHFFVDGQQDGVRGRFCLYCSLPEVEYITESPQEGIDACERIMREIEEYKWRKANEYSEGFMRKEQAE